MSNMFFDYFLWLSIIFIWVGKNFGNEKSLCVYMVCQHALDSGQHVVRACEECRKNQSRFCGEISRRIYCFRKIPTFCSQLTNKAKSNPDPTHQFCYLPDIQYLLKTPAVEKSSNNSAISFAIPRFFEDQEFEEYDFANLTLFIKFNVKSKDDCQNKFFHTHYISTPSSDCLISIPMPIPKFESNAGNDISSMPFYYDDRTDMSVEFSRAALSSLQNSTISAWYSVHAIKNLPHGDSILKFGLSLFSYRKDVLL